jgi:hypothetical protein
MFRGACWQLVTDCRYDKLFLENLDSLTIEKENQLLAPKRREATTNPGGVTTQKSKDHNHTAEEA